MNWIKNNEPNKKTDIYVVAHSHIMRDYLVNILRKSHNNEKITKNDISKYISEFKFMY